MKHYENDRKWSDQFIPQIRHIVGPYLLEAASFEVDTKEASDLVLVAKDIKIACRVRRYGYANKYPLQFTIRSHRDSGATTELTKIINGHCSWMFYGHSNMEANSIEKWFLIDLDEFRYGLQKYRRTIIEDPLSNCDGTFFCAYDISSFPNSQRLVIDSSHPLPYWAIRDDRPGMPL